MGRAFDKAEYPADAKNYILNGAMMVSQQNGTTAGTTTSYYAVDQFAANTSTTAYSVAQVASVTPAGSPNRLRVTVTAADAAVAAADIVYIEQKIEGLRVADLMFGTASAKSVVIRFGCKGPPGTYCLSVLNSAANRVYVAEYTIAAGENNISVTIPGDTIGTWLKDNGMGLSIRWGLMVGSTFQQAAGAWGTVNAVGSANQFNFMGTNGNVFELFDVGLYAVGAMPSTFVVPFFDDELIRCQRYYCRSYELGTANGANGANGYISMLCSGSATQLFGHIPFPVSMRAAPTVSMWSFIGTANNWSNGAGTNVASAGVLSATSRSIYAGAAGAGLTLGTAYLAHYAADARL